MDEPVGMGVGATLTERHRGDDMQERGDDGGAKARAAADACVGDSDSSAAGGAPEAASDGDEPSDREQAVVGDHGPGHHTMRQSVAVHADARKGRDGATGAARPAGVNVWGDREVGWLEQQVWSSHVSRLVSTAWRAGATVEK
jgi:hypothetical protein